jgi:hypothetical protein
MFRASLTRESARNRGGEAGIRTLREFPLTVATHGINSLECFSSSFIVHRFLEIDRTGDSFQTFFFMDFDLTR